MLIDTIHSKVDKTVKYIFRLQDGLITEVSYIDNGSPKDIICIGSQTSCSMKCRFCLTSDLEGVVLRNLTSQEISGCVRQVYDKQCLGNRILLVSYMGCGEPLLNWMNVIESMIDINQFQPNSRFAISTLIPNKNVFEFFKFVEKIQFYGLNVKIHLSLHFTKDEIRREWMPAALNIIPSLDALEFYRDITGNSVEIHYTLIEGVNDSVENAEELSNLVVDRQIPIKLLQYNARPCLEYVSSQDKRLRLFKEELINNCVRHEYYIPPGQDVGASCGAFLIDYYKKYNKI